MKASSAASDRSFSKAGLVVTAKRMVLKEDNVDTLCLLGWAMATQGWKDQQRQRALRRKKRTARKKKSKDKHGRGGRRTTRAVGI